MIDYQDIEAALAYKWNAHNRRGKLYASSGCGEKQIGLHNLIMNGKGIDHINGDSLDNRRSNLRTCTRQQNQWNRVKQNSSSIFKGVYFDKASGKWKAQIGMNKTRVGLGYFKTEIKAAKEYDRVAKKTFGEFAKLNFGGIK